MLDMKHIVTAIILAFIGWVGISVVDLKTNTAVIAVKVDENHKMLSVLWEDFLGDRKNGNLAWFHGETDLYSTTEKE